MAVPNQFFTIIHHEIMDFIKKKEKEYRKLSNLNTF